MSIWEVTIWRLVWCMSAFIRSTCWHWSRRGGNYGLMNEDVTNFVFMKTNWRRSITSHKAAGKVIMCTYCEWRSKVLQWWERSSIHWFIGIIRRCFSIAGADWHQRSIELVCSDGLTELQRLYQERGPQSEGGKSRNGHDWLSKQAQFQGDGEW